MYTSLPCVPMKLFLYTYILCIVSVSLKLPNFSLSHCCCKLLRANLFAVLISVPESINSFALLSRTFCFSASYRIVLVRFSAHVYSSTKSAILFMRSCSCFRFLGLASKSRCFTICSLSLSYSSYCVSYFSYRFLTS